MEERYKVFLNKNEKKGIIAATFYNPIISKRVTRSLGTEIGLEIERAEELKEYIESLINDSYYYTYDGYMQSKCKFPDNIIRLIYENTELQQQEYEERTNLFINQHIPIKNNESFCTDTVVFLGGPGVGKTKTIQQLQGSTKYNTPASTTSNTTTNMFYADIDPDATSLEMLYQLNNNNRNYECIKNNIYQLVRYLAIHAERILKQDIMYHKLLVSDDLRYNLKSLIADTHVCSSIVDGIRNDFLSIWNEFYDYGFTNVSQAVDTFISIKDDSSIQIDSIEVTDDLIELVNKFDVENYIQLLMNQLKKDKVKLLKDIVKLVKKTVFDIKNVIITLKLNDEITITATAENAESIEISDKILLNMDAMYISISYSKNPPDEILREQFFEIMQKVSCSVEETKSLLPLLAVLKMRGNFKSHITENCDIYNERFLLVDSEGVGHDAGNIENSPELIHALQYADKVVWMIDISRPIDQIEVNTLKTLAANGCLYKTTLAWTKCDEVIHNGEDINSRTFKLLENLYKEFNTNNEVAITHDDLIDNMITLGDMNQNIYGDKVHGEMRGIKFVQEFDETFRENFFKLLKFDKSKKNKSLKVSYSIIHLSNIFDEQINSFISTFSDLVQSSHWKKVQAFTNRIAGNYSRRSYEYLHPEADIKYLLKSPLERAISNPLEFDEQEKKNRYNDLQMLQEELAKQLDKIIDEIIYHKNIEKWKEIFKLSGPGSGNERKNKTVELIRSSIGFDRNKHLENKVLQDLVMKMLNMKELKNELEVNINIVKFYDKDSRNKLN